MGFAAPPPRPMPSGPGADGRPLSPMPSSKPGFQAGPPVFTPGPARTHQSAPAEPGGTLRFQTGIDANPVNAAYEDFLNQIAAEQRQARPAGRMGAAVATPGRSGASVFPAGGLGGR